MTLDIQFKIRNNPYYIKYIRENSYWYKILNRNPNMFSKFEETVKTNYQLRPSDKIKNTLEMINLMQNVISSLK